MYIYIYINSLGDQFHDFVAGVLYLNINQVPILFTMS